MDMSFSSAILYPGATALFDSLPRNVDSALTQAQKSVRLSHIDSQSSTKSSSIPFDVYAVDASSRVRSSPTRCGSMDHRMTPPYGSNDQYQSWIDDAVLRNHFFLHSRTLAESTSLSTNEMPPTPEITPPRRVTSEHGGRPGARTYPDAVAMADEISSREPSKNVIYTVPRIVEDVEYLSCSPQIDSEYKCKPLITSSDDLESPLTNGNDTPYLPLVVDTTKADSQLFQQSLFLMTTAMSTETELEAHSTTNTPTIAPALSAEISCQSDSSGSNNVDTPSTVRSEVNTASSAMSAASTTTSVTAHNSIVPVMVLSLPASQQHRVLRHVAKRNDLKSMSLDPSRRAHDFQAAGRMETKPTVSGVSMGKWSKPITMPQTKPLKHHSINASSHGDDSSSRPGELKPGVTQPHSSQAGVTNALESEQQIPTDVLILASEDPSGGSITELRTTGRSDLLTPISFASDASSISGIVEVQEATALRIHPHTNKSILVIPNALNDDRDRYNYSPKNRFDDFDDLRHRSIVGLQSSANRMIICKADHEVENLRPSPPVLPELIQVTPPTPSNAQLAHETSLHRLPRSKTISGPYTALRKTFFTIPSATSMRRAFSQKNRQPLQVTKPVFDGNQGQHIRLHPSWRPRSSYSLANQSDVQSTPVTQPPSKVASDDLDRAGSRVSRIGASLRRTSSYNRYAQPKRPVSYTASSEGTHLYRSDSLRAEHGSSSYKDSNGIRQDYIPQMQQNSNPTSLQCGVTMQSNKPESTPTATSAHIGRSLKSLKRRFGIGTVTARSEIG